MDSSQQTFADGVPREGLSRQQVLTRIGIMSLIRRKVQEFESINGLWSMPELQDKENGVQQQTIKGGAGESENVKVDVEKMDIVEKNDENETSITEMLAQANTTVKEEKTNSEEAKNTDIKKDETNKENHSSSSTTDAANPTLQQQQQQTHATSSTNALTALKSTSKVKYTKADRTDKLNSFKFMFNIADGGFTELQTLWLNEQRAVHSGHEYDTWHRRHDYWLLSGIITHGYSRWQDIQQDARFQIIAEPFNRDMKERGNYLEIKNKFLARRFKLMEQALVIEEQLRRASFLNINMNNQANANLVVDPMTGQTSSILTLNAKFTELETLSESHYHLSTQSSSGNKPANDVLKRVLTQLEELLNDMKQEVNRLPVSLTRLSSVTERLKMQERDILTRLANGNAINQIKDSTNEEQKLQMSILDPYHKYAHQIGAFVPNLSTNVGYNPNKVDTKRERTNNTAANDDQKDAKSSKSRPAAQAAAATSN
jgi:hypothetical protein